MQKIIFKLITAFSIILLGLMLLILGIDRTTEVTVLLSTILAILLIIAFIIYLVNLVLTQKLRNLKKINTESLNTKLLQLKDLAESDYNKYYKKIRKYLLLSNAYYIIITLILVSIYFILCFMADTSYIFLIMVFGFSCFTSIDFLIGPYQKVVINNEIKEEDYPSLWAIIKRANSKFDINKKIRCYLNYDNNAGINEIDNNCNIILGMSLLNIMSEEELENILIHEFAHYYKEHTKRTKKTLKKLYKWHNVVDKNTIFLHISYIMFYPISLFLSLHYSAFNLTTSRTLEHEADLVIINKGDPNVHINALAKMEIFNIYMFEERCTFYQHYQSEEITNEYFNILYTNFIKHYNIYSSQWHQLVQKRIPARIETHLTLKNRMDLLNVENFNIDFSNRLPEIEQLNQMANQLIKLEIKPLYKSKRENEYLNPLHLINEFESSENDFGNAQLFDISYAYRVFGRLEEAMEIYKKILEQDNSHPRALFEKGRLLLSLYNDDGINDIYKAMELNNNYLESGMTLIAEYCLANGLEEELNKIRTYTDEHRDFIVNTHLQVNVNFKDKFHLTALDNKIIKEIIDEISKVNTIQQIYFADKIINKQFRYTIVGVKIDSNNVEEINQILNDVFDYLDNNRREQFVLVSLNHNPFFVKKFARIRGSLVFTQ